jgi:hypothetical protein
MDEGDRRWGRWLVHIGAAALLLLVVMIATGRINLRWDGPEREGVSGTGNGGEAARSAPPSPTLPVRVTAGEVAPARVALSVDFDRVPMGFGIGDEWRPFGAPGPIEVDPLPNAVDRSARLGTADGRTVSACAIFDPAVRALALLSVEVRLGAPSASASVQVRPGTTDPALEVRLGSGSSIVIEGNDVAAEGEGLGVETWYRLEIDGDAGSVTVSGIDGSAAAPVLESSIESLRSLRAREVCLGVSGEPGDAANFDDVRVTEVE